MMRAGAGRPPVAEFGRYFAVSVVALAADVGVLMLAARFVHYLWAATLGFTVGAVVSYWLATRWAFVRRRFERRPHAEFAAYVLIGALGLGVNNLAIFLMVDLVGVPLLAGKAVAAGATFTFNYGARKLALFRA
jgi:putative flippase GtrA